MAGEKIYDFTSQNDNRDVSVEVYQNLSQIHKGLDCYIISLHVSKQQE